MLAIDEDVTLEAWLAAVTRECCVV